MKLKNVEEIIVNSPKLKKNAKSLINNFYTYANKTKSHSKFSRNKPIFNLQMNKTSMISDILTTHHSTVANTEDNFNCTKLIDGKYNIIPDYVKHIQNFSNNKTINHLLNVIVKI